MSDTIVIEEPKIQISPALLSELKTLVHEKGQVIVHCIQEADDITYIRIWPQTNLYCQHTDHVSSLVHAEKISFFPVWTEVYPGENYFTLIFSGLPKSCIVFDLIEHCDNEAGAFKVLSIPRNNTDVYYVKV